MNFRDPDSFAISDAVSASPFFVGDGAADLLARLTAGGRYSKIRIHR